MLWTFARWLLALRAFQLKQHNCFRRGFEMFALEPLTRQPLAARQVAAYPRRALVASRMRSDVQSMLARMAKRKILA